VHRLFYPTLCNVHQSKCNCHLEKGLHILQWTVIISIYTVHMACSALPYIYIYIYIYIKLYINKLYEILHKRGKCIRRQSWMQYFVEYRWRHFKLFSVQHFWQIFTAKFVAIYLRPSVLTTSDHFVANAHITHAHPTQYSYMDVVAWNRFVLFSWGSNDVYKYFQTAVILVYTYP